LNNLKRNIVNRDETQSNTELESLETQLNTITESQKDLDLKFEQGDSEVKTTTDDLTEVQTKSKDLDEIIKDAINCVDGR
jgi:peptidoglycan hydrolase CwlO-like protein